MWICAEYNFILCSSVTQSTSNIHFYSNLQAGKANTVETNLKNINVDKFDLEFEVDPMFQMMSAAFDEGGARGLLLNRLRCFDDRQQLVLDSSTSVNIVEDTLFDSQSTQKPIEVSCVTGLTYCVCVMYFFFYCIERDISCVMSVYRENAVI